MLVLDNFFVAADENPSSMGKFKYSSKKCFRQSTAFGIFNKIQIMLPSAILNSTEEYLNSESSPMYLVR